MYDYAQTFLDQNEIAAATLTRDEVEAFAEHHAGGLHVLGSYFDNGERSGYVKMHDSWGDDENVIVHEYDPDNPDPDDDDDIVHEFSTGRAALDYFLTIVDRKKA
jgi:hypothetical protein